MLSWEGMKEKCGMYRSNYLGILRFPIRGAGYAIGVIT